LLDRFPKHSLSGGARYSRGRSGGNNNPAYE
jgi:hypothetical protein